MVQISRTHISWSYCLHKWNFWGKHIVYGEVPHITWVSWIIVVLWRPGVKNGRGPFCYVTCFHWWSSVDILFGRLNVCSTLVQVTSLFTDLVLEKSSKAHITLVTCLQCALGPTPAVHSHWASAMKPPSSTCTSTQTSSFPLSLHLGWRLHHSQCWPVCTWENWKENE